jgi:predicted AlkP superfamily phosphohydrolase/phosphomutase
VNADSPGDSSPPLVVFCLDAADPELLERWAGEGHLPALAAIMERGAWAHTYGPELICEHGIWVSLCSGVSRGRHGLYSYRQLRPGTYDLETVTGPPVAPRPFWAELGGGGKKVAALDVPELYPVQGVDGLQLASWGVHAALTAPTAEPPSLLADAERVVGPPMAIGERLDGATAEDDREVYRLLTERLRKRGRLYRHLLSQDRFPVVVAGFGELHTGSHQLWKHHRKLNGSAGAVTDRELSDGILTLYKETDREIGSLLAGLPGDANVFVVSSVGIVDKYPAGGLLRDFCRRLGYEHAARPRRPIDVLRRAIPEQWRIALSRRLPRDTREGLVADQLRSGTDWPRTTAFAIPSSYTGLIRVNLRGREPEGIVVPGPEYEELLDRLEADLLALRDPETGEPAVARVGRTGELFGGGPPDWLPDLFVVWRPHSRLIARLSHPKAELQQDRPDFLRDNDHTDVGFLAAAGPSIGSRGRLAPIAGIDLAPTLLSAAGGRPSSTMGGRVADELFAAGPAPPVSAP